MELRSRLGEYGSAGSFVVCAAIGSAITSERQHVNRTKAILIITFARICIVLIVLACGQRDIMVLRHPDFSNLKNESRLLGKPFTMDAARRKESP